jgi:hypothetical protein
MLCYVMYDEALLALAEKLASTVRPPCIHCHPYHAQCFSAAGPAACTGTHGAVRCGAAELLPAAVSYVP